MMKTNLILLITCCTIISSCFDVERRCTDFKIGSFQSELTSDGKKFISTFERNDSIQIETFEGKKDTFSIRWINDCEYILKNKRPKNSTEKKSIHIKILTTAKDSYQFEYSFVGDSNKNKGLVKLLD